jgi:glycosyltransferase involved in cell wall biosynthesis
MPRDGQEDGAAGGEQFIGDLNAGCASANDQHRTIGQVFWPSVSSRIGLDDRRRDISAEMRDARPLKRPGRHDDAARANRPFTTTSSSPRGLAGERLCSYYSGPSLVVMPPLAEGVGLPPLEAMGCPLVASTGGSLPKVVGNAAITVAPQDHHGMSHDNGGWRDELQTASSSSRTLALSQAWGSLSL